MLTLQLPWVHPGIVSREAVQGESVLDLNGRFRTYLLSPQFQRNLRQELEQEILSFERLRSAKGEQVWRFYRALRLLALLAGKIVPGETATSYFHLLGTNRHWYFTSERVWPIRQPSDDLGDLGRYFVEFLKSQKVPAGRMIITDTSQDAFANLVQAHFRSLAFERISPPAGNEIEPPLSLLPCAEKHFRGSRNGLFPVTWSPRQTVTNAISRYVKQLHSKGVPITLEFRPDTDAEVPDDFIFSAMDKIVELERYIRGVTVNTGNANLDDIISVQLGAEFNRKSQLAPHRLRLRQITQTTKLKAPVPMIVESNFDLAGLFAAADPGKNSHPFRLGRGRPNEDAGAFSRSKQKTRFMIFASCPRAIPISEEDSAYSEAIEFFKTPRSVATFTSQYAPDQRNRVLGFLENLVNLEALSSL